MIAAQYEVWIGVIVPANYLNERVKLFIHKFISYRFLGKSSNLPSFDDLNTGCLIIDLIGPAPKEHVHLGVPFSPAPLPPDALYLNASLGDFAAAAIWVISQQSLLPEWVII